jgi:hypothetical protein
LISAVHGNFVPHEVDLFFGLTGRVGDAINNLMTIRVVSEKLIIPCCAYLQLAGAFRGGYCSSFARSHKNKSIPRQVYRMVQIEPESPTSAWRGVPHGESRGPVSEVHIGDLSIF